MLTKYLNRNRNNIHNQNRFPKITNHNNSFNPIVPGDFFMQSVYWHINY